MIRKIKWVVSIIVAVAIFLAPFFLAHAAGRFRGGCGRSSCGYCYPSYPCQPQYYPTYEQPTYYYPPQAEVTYVSSVQLFQPFEFRYVPPTAILQLYGVPQIASTTVTTTTTSAVSNGATQTIAVSGTPTVATNGSGNAVVRVGDNTYALNTNQNSNIGGQSNVGVTDSSSSSNSNTAANSAVAVLKNYCARCHQQGKPIKGGITLLNSQGQISLHREGGSLDWSDVIAAVDHSGEWPMPPDSDKDVSKKVPALQRKILIKYKGN